MNFQSNFSAPFIKRPVATSLVTLAIFLSGVIAFRFLPVAPLPQVDLPQSELAHRFPARARKRWRLRWRRRWSGNSAESPA